VANLGSPYLYRQHRTAHVINR